MFGMIGTMKLADSKFDELPFKTLNWCSKWPNIYAEVSQSYKFEN